MSEEEQQAKRPAASFSGSGGLNVAVWKYKTEDKPDRYSVKIERTYKDGDDYQTTQYLRDQDLLRAKELLQNADEWIEQDKGRGHKQAAGREA